MDIRIIEAIHESLRTKRAVRVRTLTRHMIRPRPQHKIFKFPLGKVKEVKVRSPHAGSR